MIEYLAIGITGFAVFCFILVVIHIILKPGPTITMGKAKAWDNYGKIIKHPYMLHKGTIVYLGSNQEMKHKFQIGDDVYLKKKHRQ